MKYYTDKRKKTLGVSYGLRSQSYGLFIFDYEKGKKSFRKCCCEKEDMDCFVENRNPEKG